MPLTTAGITHIANALVGQGTPFNTANAFIGVGDGSGIFAAAQTDLQGTNKFRKAMDSGFPVAAAPKITFKSTFQPSEANFAWAEWGVFNASTGGVMLCRTVEANGTKLSNQTWVLEVEITMALE